MKGFPAPRLLPSRQSEDRWKLDLFCRQTWWNIYFSTVHLIPMKDSTAVCFLPVLWLFPYQAYYANPYLVLLSAGKRSTTMFKKVPINRHSKAERTFFKWKTCRHPKHVVRFTRILYEIKEKYSFKKLMTVVWNSGSYAALCMNLGEMWKVALHFIAHLHAFCRLMSNCCKKKQWKNGKTSIYALYLGKILLNPTKVKKNIFIINI